jgi:hypothetical protein
MSVRAAGWANKMKAFLRLQSDSDSGGSISPPSSDDSGERDIISGNGNDADFESLFPKSLEIQDNLQAKV